MKFHLLLALATGLLLTASVQAQDNKKGIEGLQGTWVATSIKSGQSDIPEEMAGKFKLVIEGDKYTFTAPKDDKGGTVTEKGTLKLDPSKSPPAVDIHITEGAEKGKTQEGIYELTSDTWKVCVAPAGKPRPTEFTPNLADLYVFKRQK